MEYELQELRRAGISFQRDEEQFASGRIVLRLCHEVAGERINLIAVFPDLYPYFRFELYAPELDLPRHQHPFGKNLCLIGRSTANWDAGDTLASFLINRLPDVLETGRTDDRTIVLGREEAQGEPFTDYYEYQPSTIVLVDSTWSLSQGVIGGDLLIGLEASRSVILRGAVLEIRDMDGNVLARADDAMARRYPGPLLRARWTRLPAPIKANADGFRSALIQHDRRLDGPIFRTLSDGSVDVIGVVFPEETRWRETSDGWVFFVRAKGRAVNDGNVPKAYLARAGRAGRRDLSERVPTLRGLAERRVAVIGLGGIGAPSAIEFARAGVGELRIVEYDIVEPGTTVRWPLGLGVSGRWKTEALEEFLAAHYPYTSVRAWRHRIGAPLHDDASDVEVLEQVLDGVDLVYDASTEHGVHHALSELCRDRAIPYMTVATTQGGWGAVIARVRPTTVGCWICFQCARGDGLIPPPPEDPDGNVQPTGCASPTFTGAGFDVAEVALNGVRLAVATLIGSASSGYGDVEWDVAIGAIRDEAGGMITPSWQTFPLNRHPLCPACNPI